MKNLNLSYYLVFFGLWLLALMLCVVLWLYPSKKKADQVQWEGYRPVFHGEVTRQLVPYDLTGTWNAMRLVEEGKHSDLPRWKQRWVLKPEPRRPLTWQSEPLGQFGLTRSLPQFLRWREPDGRVHWFSINYHSFGLMLLTGEDGAKYMIVRTDGGEDLPYLQYDK